MLRLLMIGGMLVVSLGCLAALAVADIAPGFDAFVTQPGGSNINFGDPGDELCSGGLLPPIPADFFGPGSNPFVGNVLLTGVPIGGVGPLAGADTVVERLETAELPEPYPSSDTIPIEVVELSLASIDPITVTFDGGQDPKQFDVFVEESPNAASLGEMTITQDQANLDQGTFVSEMCIFALVTFTEVGNPANQFVLDLAVLGDSVGVNNLNAPAGWNDPTGLGGRFVIPDPVDHEGPHPQVQAIALPPQGCCWSCLGNATLCAAPTFQADCADNWVQGANCGTNACGAGKCQKRSCCLGDGGCVDDTPIADCAAMGGQPLEEGDVCLGDENENGIDDACEVDAIPTVSEWGLIIMALLALTAGTIVFARRRRPAVA